MTPSKLGSALLALAVAVLGYFGVTETTDIPHQVEIVGLLSALAGLVSPALAAQLGESGGRLFSAVGTIVLFAANFIVVKYVPSEAAQGVITSVLLLLGGLFVPAVHLHQATDHKPARPVVNRMTSG